MFDFEGFQNEVANLNHSLQKLLQLFQDEAKKISGTLSLIDAYIGGKLREKEEKESPAPQKGESSASQKEEST